MDRLRAADLLAVANGARVSGAAFVVQSRRRDDSGPIRIGFALPRRTAPPPSATASGEGFAKW